jgi:hypothetical protein
VAVVAGRERTTIRLLRSPSVMSSAPWRFVPRCTTAQPFTCLYWQLNWRCVDVPMPPQNVKPDASNSRPRQTLNVTSESSVCLLTSRHVTSRHVTSQPDGWQSIRDKRSTHCSDAPHHKSTLEDNSSSARMADTCSLLTYRGRGPLPPYTAP